MLRLQERLAYTAGLMRSSQSSVPRLATNALDLCPSDSGSFGAAVRCRIRPASDHRVPAALDPKNCCNLARGSPGWLPARAMMSSVPAFSQVSSISSSSAWRPVKCRKSHPWTPQAHRQRLDPHGIRASCCQGLQRRVDPCAAGVRTLATGIFTRHRTDGRKRPCLTSIRCRMDRRSA